jgi:hypothetical protein
MNPGAHNLWRTGERGFISAKIHFKIQDSMLNPLLQKLSKDPENKSSFMHLKKVSLKMNKTKEK